MFFCPFLSSVSTDDMVRGLWPKDVPDQSIWALGKGGKTILYKFCDDVSSVVERLKRRACDQHGLGSKPTRAILLCPWERHFTAHSPAWWSWKAVLNCSHISIELQADSNILVSPEAGRGNCLPYVLAPPSLSCESGG